MDNIDVFVEDMRRIAPDIKNEVDAFEFAMVNTKKYDEQGRWIFFGEVGNGVFYSDTNFDHCRYYPDSNIREAILSLKTDLEYELNNIVEQELF